MASELEPPDWPEPPPWDEREYGSDPLGDRQPFTHEQRGNRYERLRWLTPTECAASDPRGYIVKGLIAPLDLVLFFGGPGMGKSCLAPRIGYAIAIGKDVFGRRVKAGRVLYVAAEDGHGMRSRIAALMSELGSTDNLLMAEGLGGFMEVDGPGETLLRAKIAEFRAHLVIIDTIAAGFSGLRENDPGSDGMGRVIDFARDLIADFGVAVVLIHHVPKGDANTPRGHGLLHGDADVALALSRGEGKTIRAGFTKNRNGPSDGVLAFTIRAVTLGADEDGDPITAPICDPGDGAASSGSKLSQAEWTARGILYDLVATEGVPLPTGSGFPTTALKGVKMDRWQAECLARHLSSAKDEEGRKRGFRSVRVKLRDKGVIGMRDEWAWPLFPSE